ncbi:MAG: hypothetical protein H6738_16435 [Alphaproteobacteria bacterium]|nr:hypothetical protein [Alphaproteobacteria bacterium]MCB9698369.1 hypothetical protein [Alphaproteobacteria bacterium]
MSLERLARLGGWRLALRLAEALRGADRVELERIAAALAPPEEDEEDDVEERVRVPGFEAWEHGEAALWASTDEERGRWLDRALDAFDAIARHPIDPGNDEGPMWAIAHLLDEPRLRRALAIADRMEGAGWTYDLGGTRAALTARLAALGHVDEALSRVPGIGGTDPFAPHWRAEAWGGVLGAMLAADPTVLADQLWARISDPLERDEAFRYRVLDAVLHACPEAPSAAAVRSWLAFADGLPPRLRQLSVQHVAEQWPEALPTETWVAVCEGLPEPVDALLDLAGAVPRPRPLLEAALRLLGDTPPADALPALAEHRAALTTDELRPAWVAWLASLGDDDGARVVLDVDGVEELVLTLEGPEAALAAMRTVLPP